MELIAVKHFCGSFGEMTQITVRAIVYHQKSYGSWVCSVIDSNNKRICAVQRTIDECFAELSGRFKTYQNARKIIIGNIQVTDEYLNECLRLYRRVYVDAENACVISHNLEV